MCGSSCVVSYGSGVPSRYLIPVSMTFPSRYPQYRSVYRYGDEYSDIEVYIAICTVYRAICRVYRAIYTGV